MTDIIICKLTVPEESLAELAKKKTALGNVVCDYMDPTNPTSPFTSAILEDGKSTFQSYVLP